MRLGWPTGAPGLDTALGIGGYPRGRVVEVFGHESSGKTTLALHAIREVQAEGGVAAFIDAERALDLRYAANIGVRIDELLVSRPDCGEQALGISEVLLCRGAIDLVVVDSVPALVTRADLTGALGRAGDGERARWLSKALRKIASIASRQGAVMLFVNQLRRGRGASFGRGDVTPGGPALKFHASVRLEMSRIGPLCRNEPQVGSRTRIRVVKNKVAPASRVVEVDVVHGWGIRH